MEDIEAMISERLTPMEITNDKNKDYYERSIDEYTKKIIEARKKK